MYSMVSITLAAAIVIILAAVGAWDIYVLFAAREATTVSRVIYDWGQQFPPLVLLTGLVLGHLFWPVHGNGVVTHK